MMTLEYLYVTKWHLTFDDVRVEEQFCWIGPGCSDHETTRKELMALFKFLFGGTW